MNTTKLSNLWSVFLLLYCYLFLFIFPSFFIFIDREDAVTGTPAVAFSVLIAGSMLWIAVLLYFLNITLLRPLRHRWRASRLLRNGEKRQGIIHHRKVLNNSKNKETVQLDIRFENLKGARISREFIVIDNLPEQYRFAEEKPLNMALDPRARAPYAVFEGQRFGLDRFWQIIHSLLFLLIAAVPTWLLITSYSLYNFGYGWRFLRFYHPFFFEPILALIAIFLLNRLMNKPQRNKLLFSGKGTQATIHTYRQTGMYANEQPLIAFDISYQDEQGQTHHKVFKKIINQANLHTLASIQTLDILYNPDKPTDFIVINQPV